jgi:ADP-ribose pyrophosphatase YjhB (NUDIX family)
MYVVFFERTPLYLHSPEERALLPEASKALEAVYMGKLKFLSYYIDTLEKNHRYSYVALCSDDVESLKADFFSQFKIVEAAGGVVFDDDDKALFIYRRGSWDLPKGKIDKGETIKEAAIREVEEETGLACILGAELPTTYHTYKYKGVRVLKPTYWFEMKAKDPTKLKLQTEEDIEASEWSKVSDFVASGKEIYPNLSQLVTVLQTRYGA